MDLAPIPADISVHSGLKARMRVKGTIEGAPLKSSLVAGSGELFIVIAKELRDKISKQAGDVVKMTIGLDTSNDTVNVPVDLKKALSTNEKAKSSFGRMAPSHKKANLQWSTQAKTTETRANRIGKAVQRISVGKILR
jgi:hypothetical protein